MKEGQGDDEEEEERLVCQGRLPDKSTSLHSVESSDPLFETFLPPHSVSSQQFSFPPVLLLPNVLFLFLPERMEIRAPCPYYRSPLKRTWNLIKGTVGLQRSSKTEATESPSSP